MAILDALSLAEKLDTILTAIETGEAFTDQNTALETTAALAQIAGTTAVGGLVAAAGRFTDPLVRLGAAISGRKDELIAKGWLSGLIVAEGLSKMIDEINDRGIGVDLIEMVLPIGISKNQIQSIKQKYTDSKAITSPIILDLDGDGVETTAVGSGTWFDHDANGFAESTGWAGSDDGILVRDLDGNGTIDSGRELFGSETLLANGQKAANGFQALAELDSNLDGKIDANDAAYTTLKIWKDVNGDGTTDAGELLTLAEAGVQSLNVGYTASTATDANGNQHQQIGSYTTTTGATRAAEDVWFKVDKTNTIAEDWVAVSADIAALPDVTGYGNVYDLHQAMARDGAANDAEWRVLA